MKKNLSRLVPAITRALHDNYEHRKRKEAEAERDHLLKDLERRVNERTHELEAEMVGRKQARDALKWERDLLQAIMDGAGNFHLVYLDRDFNFVRVNETYAKTCGYKPEGMIGKNHFALYPHEENKAIFTRVRDTGRAEEYKDKPFIFPDQPERGTTYWDWTLTPVKDDSGSVKGLVFSLRETTERKRAEGRLKESEKRFHNYFEMPFMGMAITSPDKEWLEANDKLCSMLGYSREELLKKTWPELTHPDDLAPDFEQFNKMLSGQIDSYLLDKRFIRKDGAIIWTNLAIGCIRNSDGSVKQFSASILDITERKRVEEQLKRQTAMLEDANQELEAFIYSVSHDLQAPVRAAEGFAAMILKEHSSEMDAEFRRKFNVIIKNSILMGDLIQGLLDLSRVGRTEISVTKLNMKDLFENVWHEIKNINPGRNIEIVQKEFAPVHGDQRLIRQVFYNLLANAVKFTQHREKAIIEVGSYSEDELNVYYMKDNGAGFDMKNYEKLFRVFQRLHSASEFTGTGIGLAIVQRILKRHGGQIWADGKKDEGTVFFFSLPAAYKARTSI